MKEIPELKTTLDGLLALDHLRGIPGSFQDALHSDAAAAHAMRDTLDWTIQERDRFREALEAIVTHQNTIAGPNMAAHSTVCTIARNALKG